MGGVTGPTDLAHRQQCLGAPGDPGQQPGAERSLDRALDEAVGADDRGQQPFELLMCRTRDSVGILAQRSAVRAVQPRPPVETRDDPAPGRHCVAPRLPHRPELEPPEAFHAVTRRRRHPSTEVGIGRLERGDQPGQGPEAVAELD